MAQLANKTFFRFLFGFLAIVAVSFGVIIGTTYLSEQDAKQNTAQVVEEE